MCHPESKLRSISAYDAYVIALRSNFLKPSHRNAALKAISARGGCSMQHLLRAALDQVLTGAYRDAQRFR